MNKMAIPIAKVLEQKAHIIPGKFRVTEHFFEVPRDYNSPSSGTLRLFARSVRRHTVPVAPEGDPDNDAAADAKKKAQLPWLIYLQGGPGLECRAPNAYPFTNSFLDKGYQLLYLDQRGTGLSSPISTRLLESIGNDNAQATYLKLFRADAIVKDCEAVRQALTSEYPESNKKWSLIGQSFGGFCCTTYLSMFPQSIREAFLTGGLPPLVSQPDDVYKRLFKKLVRRNETYYQKYPEDVQRVKSIVRHLKANNVRLPSSASEGRLTPQRFLQLGISFGFHGGLDNVHDIVLRVSNELETMGYLTRQTAAMIECSQPFDNNLIYSVLHEPIYCQGHASQWSAQRVMEKTYPGFDPNKTVDLPNQPVYFTGEMIFPWMFQDYAELRKINGAANLLALDQNWPPLYNIDQLKANDVPVYAAVYAEDMYVDYDYSMETARMIKGCKILVTNVMYHNAITSKMEEVIEGLWKLRCDTID